eukprot:CAMPEP_0198211306 /NCGR_PEP_ID=MMETSP1445-20131203/23065_1 /TAXON_ID=36898 /ORGANISM="Pyramimonas sp., Strain CCMP2087" /LENGTH=278 /DNA_ID=CAMNT_0043885531 /DNA_START=214 /DNA_END=1050 /DNA_ORIENTATION=+
MAEAEAGTSDGQAVEEHLATHCLATGMPRKRFYRARAHSNPLNDSQFPVPQSTAHVDWHSYFPDYFPDESKPDAAFVSKDPSVTKVTIADVGCGFGGLMINLSQLFPKELVVGMELRDKVSEYVKERVLALRKTEPGKYDNCACIRTNSMRYMPNYFTKGQLTKLFFLFPDPHFKASNHRRRIVTRSLLAEYAFILAEGGVLYTVTDVPELGQWMSFAMEAHPLFERIEEEDLKIIDPLVYPLLTLSSEEGKKVQRNEGLTCINVFRRIKASPNLSVP